MYPNHNQLIALHSDSSWNSRPEGPAAERKTLGGPGPKPKAKTWIAEMRLDLGEEMNQQNQDKNAKTSTNITRGDADAD